MRLKTDLGVLVILAPDVVSVRDAAAVAAAVYLGHILCVVFSAQTYFLLWVAVFGSKGSGEDSDRNAL